MRPQRPKPTRTKQGWRLFPPSDPTIWHIGEQAGKQIRAAAADTSTQGSGRNVHAHIRRAHWHGYWTGPHDGQRRFRYNWLSPMLIGGSSDGPKETL